MWLFGVKKLIRTDHSWCLYMDADNSLSSGLANLFWVCFVCADRLGITQPTSDPEHGDGVGYGPTRVALPSVLDSLARNKRPCTLSRPACFYGLWREFRKTTIGTGVSNHSALVVVYWPTDRLRHCPDRKFPPSQMVCGRHGCYFVGPWRIPRLPDRRPATVLV